MSDIRRIYQEVAKLYPATREPKIKMSPADQVKWYISYAQDFIAAASIIDSRASQHVRSRWQMTGQAVELALKTCIIVATRKNAPRGKKGHDLIKLCEMISEYGFHLEERDVAALCHLGHVYSWDLATGSKYKSRYPADYYEPNVAIDPGSSAFESIVQSLIEQAKEKSQ